MLSKSTCFLRKYTTTLIFDIWVQFHFADIAEHVNRVQAKILQQQPGVDEMSSGEPRRHHTTTILYQVSYTSRLSFCSDFIGHGLMDSMVDAFIPIIDSIELEVEGVDDLVSGMGDDFDVHNPEPAIETKPDLPSWLNKLSEKWEQPARNPSADIDEKLTSEKGNWPSNTTFQSAQDKLSQGRHLVRKLVLHTLHWVVRTKQGRVRKQSSRMRTLLRMSRTRRMVILLARLLAPKNEILGHLRKRLAIDDLGTQFGDVQG